ncbi:MAG TPA: DUF4340 domain-containing protein [Candidatus Choladousia intestinavium]|uniref:DUF4340 domain-containing protein n=1 Tax=Candidatus Choladousia intestinavium TaxID=2840727 RepID=A0A9D1ABR1_9FIRM|nr:DUF4340 domain-containing protein [Candidatus Choladousia intestinavium]
MKKKSRTLILGASSLVILSGAYLLLRIYNQNAQEAELAESAQEEILSLDEDTLASVSFEIDGSEVTFLYEDEEWSLENDPEFPVDSTYLMTTLSYLEPLEAVRTLEEVTDTGEYGIDEPQNTITLTDSEGTETILTIGSTNISTGDDYLMLNDDSSTIYTINTSLRDSLHDDLYDYAEGEELPYILSSEISGLSVEKADGSYELLLEDAVWMVQGDGTDAASADQDAVDTVISSIAGASYADYLEYNCTSPEDYGLDDPAAVLTILYEEDSETQSESEDASEEASTESDSSASESEEETEAITEEEAAAAQLTLLIGSTGENGDYYVQQDGSTEVHTISYDTLSPLLEKTGEDFEETSESETETVSEEETEAAEET